MTSITNQTKPKVQGIDADIPTRQKIDWPPKKLQGIYKDWGKYYSRRGKESDAVHNFDKALALKSDDYETLYHSSQTKRKTGKSDDALSDCRHAQKILKSLNTSKFPVNLETCDALFDLNQFEDAKIELHENKRLFSGNRRQNFEARLNVVDETLKDTCGKGLSPFMLENENIFKHVKELINAQTKVDDRPLWKKLREQDQCDILSIPEIEEEILSPLEMARRKRAFDICNQVHMNRAWIDVLFMNDLRKNRNLLLKQCGNNEYLKKLTGNQYRNVRKFLSLLRTRSPMYNARYMKTMSHRFKEASLFRMQYQTRRDMMTILQNIKQYRLNKNLSKLGSYVEEVMGDYVVLKTDRIMPWKFEFMNEVYNIYALALSEQYYVPNNFRPNNILSLLRHAVYKPKHSPTFVFGDRSTYLHSDAGETKSNMLVRLEKRLALAKHSIEKCYLLHQIANIHLQTGRYDECCSVARKATDESKNCNSVLWNLLATIIIIKSNASLGKVEATKLAIESGILFAQMLKCDRLIDFFQLCHSYGDISASKGSVQVSNRDSN